MTLSMAVFNITARDFTPGLTFAISRVKTLDGVLFEEPFDFDRFRRLASDFARMRLADIERRCLQHVCCSFTYTTVNIYATNICSTSVSLPQTLWHLTCHFGFPPPSDRRRILTIPIGHPPAEAAVQHILYIVLLHTLCFSLYVFMF
jgi:hypothetical protein